MSQNEIVIDKEQIINNIINYIKFKKKKVNLEDNFIDIISTNMKKFIDKFLIIYNELNDENWFEIMERFMKRNIEITSRMEQPNILDKITNIITNIKNIRSRSNEIVNKYIFTMNNDKLNSFDDNIFKLLIDEYININNLLNKCFDLIDENIDTGIKWCLEDKKYKTIPALGSIISSLLIINNLYTSIDEPNLKDKLKYYANKIIDLKKNNIIQISGGKNNKEYINYKFQNKVYRRVIRYEGKKKYIILNKTRIYIKK